MNEWLVVRIDLETGQEGVQVGYEHIEDAWKSAARMNNRERHTGKRVFVIRKG